MKTSIEDQVRARARECCEYCQIPQSASDLRHEIDHVVAKQHGGATELDNLALCCVRCNLFKGPNIAGIDPETKKLCRLFHPRCDKWSEHFAWDEPRLVGKSDVGRTTVVVLAMNAPQRVAARQ